MGPQEIIKSWVKAFNDKDVEMLGSLYAVDAINHQVVQHPIEGKEEIIRFFTEAFKEAEMECLVENIFEDGEWGIIEWKDPLGLRGCGFFHIVDGKIIFQRGYWDKLSFLRQHGLPIPLK